MPPQWLSILAYISLVVAGLCSAVIVLDIFARGYRQPMKVMEVVWPVTALYLGPFAVLGYLRWGRPLSDRWRHEHGSTDDRPFWATVAVGVTHCGGGCTIGDIIGGWLVFLAALQIAGLALFAEFAVDFMLAFALGIAFQYFAIVPMRKLSFREGITASLKADTASLSAFEVGLFGWMAVVQLVFFTAPHLEADHVAYWFMMQIGMALGFLTSYPVNWWLIRRGIKEAM